MKKMTVSRDASGNAVAYEMHDEPRVMRVDVPDCGKAALVKVPSAYTDEDCTLLLQSVAGLVGLEGRSLVAGVLSSTPGRLHLMLVAGRSA
jgi:hypothetical protein